VDLCPSLLIIVTRPVSDLVVSCSVFYPYTCVFVTNLSRCVLICAFLLPVCVYVHLQIYCRSAIVAGVAGTPIAAHHSYAFLNAGSVSSVAAQPTKIKTKVRALRISKGGLPLVTAKKNFWISKFHLWSRTIGQTWLHGLDAQGKRRGWFLVCPKMSF